MKGSLCYTDPTISRLLYKSREDSLKIHLNLWFTPWDDWIETTSILRSLMQWLQFWYG